MKNLIKKGLCFILLLTLSVGIIGCGKSSNKSKEEETSNKKVSQETANKASQQGTEEENNKSKWYVGEEVTFNWYLNYSWWKHNKDWLEYPILKEISDITGVVPTVSIPSGDGTEKINLMIATNELPDLITLDMNDPLVDKLVELGLVYSYDELIDKYCPEFRDEIPEDIFKYASSDVDNKLYGLPSWLPPAGMANNATAYNVRNDIYTELGEPDMTTIDGFVNALKSFKEKYPKMEGKNSIPLSLGEKYGNKSVLEKSFGIREYYVSGDNQLQHQYKDPKYVNFVKFINQLYRDGLLDQEGYIKKNDQIKEDYATRVFAAPTGWWGLWDANAALNKVKTNSGFIVTEPLDAPGEKFEVGQSRQGWTTSLISKTAKNPGEILKFTRYLWSPEGNKLLIYGHEGKDYTVEGNKLIRSEGFMKEWEKDSEGYREKTGMFTFRFFQYSYWDNALTGGLSDAESEVRKRNRAMSNSFVTYDSTAFTYKMKPNPTTPEGIIYTQVKEVIEREYPKIVMAKSEDEAIKAYEELIKKMDKVGLQKLEEWYTARYQKNLKKFN